MTSVDWSAFIAGAIVALCFAGSYVAVSREVIRRRHERFQREADAYWRRATKENPWISRGGDA